jgi:DNA-binding transcriptional regulator YbjK
MTSNRERALRAAVELVGAGGVRALTHGRVDEAAGLPKGSTSNYFRTRAALLEGVVSWMLVQQLTEVGSSLEVDGPEDLDALVEALVGLFDFLTGPERSTTRARLALLVETGHDPVLRDLMGQGRRTMIDALAPTLTRLGAPNPELAGQALASCFQGLFLADLVAEDLDARAVIALVVRGAVAEP